MLGPKLEEIKLDRECCGVFEVAATDHGVERHVMVCLGISGE